MNERWGNYLNSHWTRRLAVLLAAVVMSWPALYNRYPLLYPDSISYLGDGPHIARAAFLRDFSGCYGYRSLIYSIGILPLHWNVTPWPIVAFNALVVSYILWLVVRSLLPQRTVTNFLSLAISLSLLTGLGWLVGWIMPDVFGPLLYLSIYLLVFGDETLVPREHWTVALIAWWALASHATHLLLAAIICAVLLVMLLIQHHTALQSLRKLSPVVTVTLVALLAQLALNKYLNGEIALNSDHPPFLLARIIADGPGRWYLEQRCDELHFSICAYAHDLPNNVDDFLWGANGWSESSPEKQRQLRDDEPRVLLGTVLAYPREELSLCIDHFRGQLLNYGVYSYDGNRWISENIDTVLPGNGLSYQRSRQAESQLPEESFTSLQQWTVVVSLAVSGAWIAFARPLWSRRLIGLTAIIICAVIANAAIAGNFSNVEDRLQARVIWLVPLLAGIFVLTWLDRHVSPNKKQNRGNKLLLWRVVVEEPAHTKLGMSSGLHRGNLIWVFDFAVSRQG